MATTHRLKGPFKAVLELVGSLAVRIFNYFVLLQLITPCRFCPFVLCFCLMEIIFSHVVCVHPRGKGLCFVCVTSLDFCMERLG